MTYKIMLADDEPIMRKALQSLIDWEKIECEIIYAAENGQEVLNALTKMQPDILITDIKMPGADGIEISKYICENKLTTKVILLTAYADFSYAQSAIRYNVVEYVTKTGNFDELLKAIERCKALLMEQKVMLSEEKEARMEHLYKKVMDMVDDFKELYASTGANNVQGDSGELNIYSTDIKNEMQETLSFDSKQKLIKESLEYIDKHYREQMSVSDISRALGTSTSYLSRIFKETTGETIIRTINNKRIEKAKMYLKETDYKVYEIADILGFENVTYFSRFFKKHIGLSPKDYKEEMNR